MNQLLCSEVDMQGLEVIEAGSHTIVDVLSLAWRVNKALDSGRVLESFIVGQCSPVGRWSERVKEQSKRT